MREKFTDPNVRWTPLARVTALPNNLLRSKTADEERDLIVAYLEAWDRKYMSVVLRAALKGIRDNEHRRNR